MPSILIVDDQQDDVAMLNLILQPLDADLLFLESGADALNAYAEKPRDLVLVKVEMQDMDGMTVLNRLRETDPNSLIILLSESPDMDTAMNALKAGATDFLTMPVGMTELMDAVVRGLELSEAHKSELPDDSDVVNSMDECLPLIGNDEKMAKVREQVEKLIPMRSSLLIQGPEGCCQKTIASLLHHAGPLRDGRFVSFDCEDAGDAEIEENLLGSDRSGGVLFRRAIDGTLFLDNVESLPEQSQNHLAEVFRIYSDKMRLICGSRTDLESMVDAEQFSVDLFYRVALSVINIPPLSERPEDIPALIEHILQIGGQFDITNRYLEFTPKAIEKLKEWEWPGNLKELINVLKRTSERAKDDLVEVEDLAFRTPQSTY